MALPFTTGIVSKGIQNLFFTQSNNYMIHDFISTLLFLWSILDGLRMITWINSRADDQASIWWLINYTVSYSRTTLMVPLKWLGTVFHSSRHKLFPFHSTLIQRHSVHLATVSLTSTHFYFNPTFLSITHYFFPFLFSLPETHRNFPSLLHVYKPWMSSSPNSLTS